MNELATVTPSGSTSARKPPSRASWKLVCKRPCASGTPAPEAKTTRKLRGCSVTPGKVQREICRIIGQVPVRQIHREVAGIVDLDPIREIPIAIGQCVTIAGHEFGEGERCVDSQRQYVGQQENQWQCAHRADSHQSGIITSGLASHCQPLVVDYVIGWPTEFTDSCDFQSGCARGAEACGQKFPASCV